MTPKRHAIAKEIIKLLYPGPPFGGELFFNLFGYIGGRDAERRAAGGDGLDAGTGKTAAREIKMGPLRESGGASLRKEGWNCR